MKVLVRRGRAQAPVSAGENAPLDLTRMGVTEEELNSEVELLRDDEVLRKVIEETGAGGRDWLHILHLGEGRPQRVERAARRLAQRLNVDPVKKTNLIAIRVRGIRPARRRKNTPLGRECVSRKTYCRTPFDRRIAFPRKTDRRVETTTGRC